MPSGSPVFTGTHERLLDLRAGAPEMVESELYDHMVSLLLYQETPPDSYFQPPRYTNETRRLGINILQEQAAVVEQAARCNHLRRCFQFSRICLCRALQDHGFLVIAVRDGPEWVSEEGSNMLEPFGLRVDPAFSEELHRQGRFIVDDGLGHAFAVVVGAYSIVSFQTGIAELMTSRAWLALIDDTRIGNGDVFCIHPCSRGPFQQGGWTPPWNSRRDHDSLCGADDDESSVECSSEAVSDTDQPDLGKELLSILCKERAAYAEKVQTRKAYGQNNLKDYPCQLCVYRAFSKPDRLRKHVAEDHVGSHKCSSSKHLMATKAVWSERCAAKVACKFISVSPSTGDLPSDLLQSTADKLRAMLTTCPSFGSLGTSLGPSFDEVTAWAVTSKGTVLFLKCDASSLGYLRCGDYYYTEDFLAHVMAWSLSVDTRAAINRVRKRMIDHFTSCGAALPFLVPQKEVILTLQVEAIKKYSHIRVRCHEQLQSRGAFRAITLDGAFKYLLGVVGQPRHGAKRTENDNRDGIHVVVTGRTIDGCMFFAEAFGSESPVTVLPRLAAIPGVFEQTQVLGVDRPRDWDSPLVFAGLPLLRAVFGDFHHVVFAVASCFGARLKPGVVSFLRMVAMKWCAAGTNSWLETQLYSRTRGTAPMLTDSEQSAFQTPPFTMRGADRYLNRLDTTVPFRSRYEYLIVMGAIKFRYTDQLHRKTGDNKTTLGQVINMAAQTEMVEYYANGARWRSANGITPAQMCPGTVGNEGHHGDLKAVGRNIISMTRQRALTGLSMWELSKLLRHESSFYSPNPQKNDEQHGQWLERVLAKTVSPICVAVRAPMTVRVGNGDRNKLRRASVVKPKRVQLKKPIMGRPTLKRPASNGSQFATVWKRPSTRVTF